MGKNSSLKNESLTDKLELDETKCLYSVPEFPENTFRYFTKEEIDILGLKKIGILMELENLGIINAEIREKTLDALANIDEAFCDLEMLFYVLEETIRETTPLQQALKLTKLLEDYSLTC